jgi:hypothetical protein
MTGAIEHLIERRQVERQRRDGDKPITAEEQRRGTIGLRQHPGVAGEPQVEGDGRTVFKRGGRFDIVAECSLAGGAAGKDATMGISPWGSGPEAFPGAPGPRTPKVHFPTCESDAGTVRWEGSTTAIP